MEDDVFAIRRTFEEIIAGRNRETVRTSDIFTFLVRSFIYSAIN